MAQKFIVPISVRNLASASSQGIAVSVDGDTNDRVLIEAGGRIVWGSGSAAGDTNLYRDSANTLKTDDAFTASSLGVTGAFTLPTADGSSGQVLRTDGSGSVTWVTAGVQVSDTPPSSPVTGDLWFESDTGDVMVYYDNTWVDVAGTSVANIAMQTTAPSNPLGGDLWLDTDTGQLYVRYSDGTSDQWIEVGASAAAASGVDGAVQFASGGTFASDANNFYWDDTNNRLGIGTNTPTVSLDVVGDTFVASASGDDYLNVDVQADDTRLRTRLSRSLSMDGQSVAISASDPDTETAVPLSIDGDPVTITNLTGAGAVDFTQADSVALDGSITDYGTSIALNSGDNQLVTQLVTDGSTWGEVRAWDTNTESNIELYLGGSTVYVGNDVDAGSGTLFVDASTNRVGINDSTPSYALDVNGDINATGSIRSNGVSITSNHGWHTRMLSADALTLTTSLQWVPFGYDDIDTDSYHDTTTNKTRVTIPSNLGGWYAISMRVAITYVNPPSLLTLFCRPNGNGNATTGTLIGTIVPQATFGGGGSVSGTIYLPGGTYIEMGVYATGGSSVSLLGTSTGQYTTVFHGVRVSP